MKSFAALRPSSTRLLQWLSLLSCCSRNSCKITYHGIHHWMTCIRSNGPPSQQKFLMLHNSASRDNTSLYLYITTDCSATALHVFADASLKVYGAVIHIQFNNHSSLVMSKSHVAPVKQHSPPRLELMAAVVAARLGSFVVQSLNLDASTFYWSDSHLLASKQEETWTIYWPQSKRNSDCIINMAVLPYGWYPTDLLTCGLTAQRLADSTLWRHIHHGYYLLPNGTPGILQKPCLYRPPLLKVLCHLLVTITQPYCHLLMAYISSLIVQLTAATPSW